MSGETAAASPANSPDRNKHECNDFRRFCVPRRRNSKMRHHTFITTIVLGSSILLLGGGCGHSLLGGGGSEGVIEYTMTFPNMDPDGLMSDMLPEKTVLSFNREHQSLDLSAGMGIFRTSMVVNTSAQVLNYHMSIMGKNLVAELRRRDLITLNKTPPTFAVIQTLARDTIAGLPCKQAYLIYEGIDVPEVEVWYTEGIQMDTPNWYGPFSEIPGVLMRYEMVQHNIRMRMEATAVKMGPVDQSKFAMRADHQKVSPEVLYQQLDEVLGTFSQ